MKEFIDEQRDVAIKFVNLLEQQEELSTQELINNLEQIKQEDPDYLDTWAFLAELYSEIGDEQQAIDNMNDGFMNALELVEGVEGVFPDVLEWGHETNQHIIRMLTEQGKLFWYNEDIVESLDLFRDLLRSNPNDELGVRHYLLAVLLGMQYEDFEDRFNKEEGYDQEVFDWFEDERHSFSEEFEMLDEG